MIKVSVFYPNTDGGTFDFAYYQDSHMPMIQRLVGDACKRIEIDEGLAGGLPGQPPTYRAAGHLFFESLEAFQTTFGPHAKAILSDVPNYTNLAPIVQISAVRT
ncbi:EthD family reductase [Burkholderia guangdongensis]|uniref:EthD family reductase n=1 Tax=Burkholderia guangdongensis TaxID=1792500 RepID=UPI0015CB586E|nr:EthD family reductase [Burkholderia guangdongensis]